MTEETTVDSVEPVAEPVTDSVSADPVVETHAEPEIVEVPKPDAVATDVAAPDLTTTVSTESTPLEPSIVITAAPEESIVSSDTVPAAAVAPEPIDADVKQFHALSHLEDEAKDVFAYLGIGNEGLEKVFAWVANKLEKHDA